MYVGTSGFSFPSWKGGFYPPDAKPADFLRLYSERLPTVELNNTFYRLPTLAAASKWAEETPRRFRFTVKASRYLTHVKRLADVGRGAERFFGRVEPLADAGKLGPVLWQFPENFHRDDERLESGLEELPRGRHAFEFRHPSWFCEEVYTLLRRARAALVIGDHPERPFQTHELTASWTLIRFHYGRRGRDGNYSERELEEWARRIAQWRRRVEVYAYFNNDWRGCAVRNARRLRDALA